MNRLGIVILNYKTYSDTLECIESIKNQDYNDIEIVVVDNHSEDGSYQKLLENFKDVDNVHIIHSNTNVGFARGNNLGIEYCRENLKCNFVFVLNSDTLFVQNDTCSQLIKSYKSGIGIINPVCCNIDSSFQSPYGKFTGNMWRDTFFHFLFILWSLFRNIFKINVSISKRLEEENIDSMDRYEYIIQGPAYILTPSFFDNYNRLFPKTFLYEEELLLAWYINKAKLKTTIVKKASIIHKEAGSSKHLTKSNAKLLLQLQSLYKGLPMFFMSKNGIKKRY